MVLRAVSQVLTARNSIHTAFHVIIAPDMIVATKHIATSSIAPHLSPLKSFGKTYHVLQARDISSRYA